MGKIKNIKIKTQKPTFAKSDLKTGDVVLRRNGKVGIVLLELGTIISERGYSTLDNLNNDLTTVYAIDKEEWDVIAVRRPKLICDCQFCAFKCEFGTLVYQRFE